MGNIGVIYGFRVRVLGFMISGLGLRAVNIGIIQG